MKNLKDTLNESLNSNVNERFDLSGKLRDLKQKLKDYKDKIIKKLIGYKHASLHIDSSYTGLYWSYSSRAGDVSDEVVQIATNMAANIMQPIINNVKVKYKRYIEIVEDDDEACRFICYIEDDKVAHDIYEYAAGEFKKAIERSGLTEVNLIERDYTWDNKHILIDETIAETWVSVQNDFNSDGFWLAPFVTLRCYTD